MYPIIGEIVAGSGTTFTLKYALAPNTLDLRGSGVFLTDAVDYSVSGSVITILNGNYSAGQVVANYSTTQTITPTTQSGNDILWPGALTTLQRVKDLLFDPNITILLTGATLTNGSETVSAYTVPTGRSIRAGQQISGLGISVGTTIASVNGATMTLSQNAIQGSTGSTLTVVDQTPQYDGLLIRMINSVSHFVCNECGRTSFVQQTYVNDTYSIDNPRQSYLYLRNTPVFPAADGVHLESFQWRAGTPTNPSWTDFIGDQYEMVDPRTDPISGLIYYPSGIIRVYGVLPRIYNNMIRATYVGGYPVNWNDAEDGVNHLLPTDITNLCENLVVRRFKRRSLAGQNSQVLQGATMSWRNALDEEDVDTIGQYKQINF